MAKDLEKAEGGGLAIPEEILAEMEAASAEAKSTLDLQDDVRLPQLRLVQATTQDVEANPGQLIDTLTGDALDSAEVVMVDTWKTRAFFAGGSIGDPPVCTSPNALDGFGDPGDHLEKRGPLGGGSCQDCPQSNWRQGGKCQLRYNYLGMAVGEGRDLDVELPRAIMMHGTSAKVANRLNTLLLGSKFLWSSVVRLTSKSEKNDRGTYRIWDFSRSRPVTEGEMLAAYKWHKTVKTAKNVVVEVEDRPAPVSGDDDIPF